MSTWCSCGPNSTGRSRGSSATATGSGGTWGGETGYRPRFPLAHNGVEWGPLYGGWKKAGYAVDVCLMFDDTPPRAWRDPACDADLARVQTPGRAARTGAVTEPVFRISPPAVWRNLWLPRAARGPEDERPVAEDGTRSRGFDF